MGYSELRRNPAIDGPTGSADDPQTYVDPSQMRMQDVHGPSNRTQADLLPARAGLRSVVIPRAFGSGRDVKAAWFKPSAIYTEVHVDAHSDQPFSVNPIAFRSAEFKALVDEEGMADPGLSVAERRYRSARLMKKFAYAHEEAARAKQAAESTAAPAAAQPPAATSAATSAAPVRNTGAARLTKHRATPFDAPGPQTTAPSPPQRRVEMLTAGAPCHTTAYFHDVIVASGVIVLVWDAACVGYTKSVPRPMEEPLFLRGADAANPDTVHRTFTTGVTYAHNGFEYHLLFWDPEEDE